MILNIYNHGYLFLVSAVYENIYPSLGKQSDGAKIRKKN